MRHADFSGKPPSFVSCCPPFLNYVIKYVTLCVGRSKAFADILPCFEGNIRYYPGRWLFTSL